MKQAYNELYLEDAMKNLGEAFDYAANLCRIPMDDFMQMFIVSGLAQQFGSGVPKYIVGMSGTELALESVRISGKQTALLSPIISYTCSPEYWCGWILAYYQWHTGKPFKSIWQSISMEDIYKLYPTLHEASEEKFVDTVNALIQNQKIPTRLQIMRRASNYSQRMLAEKSGVSLRMIQQYEQRAKDIHKATATNLLALSKTLGCRMEDLLD